MFLFLVFCYCITITYVVIITTIIITTILHSIISTTAVLLLLATLIHSIPGKFFGSVKKVFKQLWDFL